MIKKIDIQKIVEIAEKAGEVILEIYDEDFTVEFKEDKSPLTKADLNSNKLITENLQKLYPEIPILSEEQKAIPFEIREKWDYFWCVDPLDGTKEFVKRNGEFTVNIALIHKNKPILGVIFSPVLRTLYYAKEGFGCFKKEKDGKAFRIKSRDIEKQEKLVFVGSRSHQSPKLKDFMHEKEKQGKKVELVTIGSSLKFCLVAEGKADIYPRFGNTHEWDSAAGHCIVNESGKKIYLFDSDSELTYNKKLTINDWFIVK